MAKDKEKIFKKAIEVIESKKLFTIEDVVAYLPIVKSTFYSYFPIDSNEMNVLKDMIDNNKISVKNALMQKWYRSDNATLQMGLMKIICSNEERKKLSISYNENNDNVNINPPIFPEDKE